MPCEPSRVDYRNCLHHGRQSEGGNYPNDAVSWVHLPHMPGVDGDDFGVGGVVHDPDVAMGHRAGKVVLGFDGIGVDGLDVDGFAVNHASRDFPLVESVFVAIDAGPDQNGFVQLDLGSVHRVRGCVVVATAVDYPVDLGDGTVLDHEDDVAAVVLGIAVVANGLDLKYASARDFEVMCIQGPVAMRSERKGSSEGGVLKATLLPFDLDGHFGAAGSVAGFVREHQVDNDGCDWFDPNHLYPDTWLCCRGSVVTTRVG